MDKLKVHRIKKGDTIGLICPSSYLRPNQEERITKACEILLHLGYNVKFGKTRYLKDGYLAGSDQERIEDIERMFLDKDVQAVLCIKGGFGASRIVDKINYELIKENPKLFIGFSDITAFLNNIYKYSNLPTVHGQVAVFLASSKCDDLSLNDFSNLLSKKTKGRVLAGSKYTKTLNEGTVVGEVVGGNLCLISDLYGTSYEIDFEDKIVLIEEVEEEPYNIDRMFAQLRLGKSLNKAKGFIFGHFTDCIDSENANTYTNLIKEYFKDLNVPIIYNFPTGHDFPFLNIPIGLKVELDATNKKITILEELYED